ncbi:histone acetyltransferase type B subunit 2 [Auriculariales sp. MPI-PUGE-AT-0066]|nr:histone acetyltransferase type B subunit 2 [Auriculariales sp. MPI-PUGE-AT-0066]
MDDEQQQAEETNKIINEEYKIWKKNAPFLYDVVVTHALDWPSLTVQWFPDVDTNGDKPFTTHRLLMGTHTSGQANDYVTIANVQLPKRELPDNGGLDREAYDEERAELGGYGAGGGDGKTSRVQVVQKINHEGEVNRARYMPQNPDLIATKTTNGTVLLFDRTEHPSEPDADGTCRPQMRLVGQTQDGWGVSWNPTRSGHILSCSDTVCHWDINGYTKGKTELEALSTYKGHTSVVTDVAWNQLQENIFGSVGDDKQLMIWDTREADRSKPSQAVEAHEQGVLCIAFSPAKEHLILTGSHDRTIALWDSRYLQPSRRLHSFEQHADDVLTVQWSPHHPTLFASASEDRRVHVWDLARIGMEQTPEDAEDGPPELVFVHGGHTTAPSDFCWAPVDGAEWTLASVANDNVLQVWAPSVYVWAGEEVRVHEGELEDGAGSRGAGIRRGKKSVVESSGEEDEDEEMDEDEEEDPME